MCKMKTGIIYLFLLTCFFAGNISIPVNLESILKSGHYINKALAYEGSSIISNVLECEITAEDEIVPPDRLARPDKPVFEDGIAAWLQVENENCGYSLQLYKDDIPLSQPVIVAHGEELIYDFNNAFAGIGDYAVTVRALGNGEYADSEESEHSNSYSDYISQFNSINDMEGIQQALEDGRLMLSLVGYNALSPLGKYLAAEELLRGKGGGYEGREDIQAALDSEVSSLVILKSSVRSLIYVCNGTAVNSMEIVLKTDYGSISPIDDRLKVDSRISFNLSFTSDVIIKGFVGTKEGSSIGTITITAGSSHFWLSDFLNEEERPALNTKADKTESYTFVIENIPEELNNASMAVTLSTIASVPGHFEDAGGMWIDELSSDSIYVKIGSPEKPVEVYVDNEFKLGDPGWGAIRFNDIHDAVDYVPQEGIVHIGKDTYYLTDPLHKQLIINKKVTIKGEGKDSTTLYVYSAPYNVLGAIYVDNTTGFNLYDLTIDGGNKSFTYAVYATGGHVDIENVRIKNINNDSYGTGIRINNNTSGYPDMLSVNGCSFENISRYGVFVSGAQADIGTRYGNTFTGGYTAYSKENDSQSAIYVSGGEVNIENNHISGYKKPDSAGIYIASGTVRVNDNTITDCTVDIRGEVQKQ